MTNEMSKRFDERFGMKEFSKDTFVKHATRTKDVIDFTQSEIDLAVAEDRKRIVEMIKNKRKLLQKEIKKYDTLPFYREAGEIRGEIVMATDIISLINKTQ